MLLNDKIINFLRCLASTSVVGICVATNSAHGAAVIVYERSAAGAYELSSWTGGLYPNANYTYSTVIVADLDKNAAKIDFPYYFNFPLSPTGHGAPTHWASSGAFGNDELEFIINFAEWSSSVYLKDTEPFSTFTYAGLLPDYDAWGSPTPVPAPLPILGAVAALGWSRKLRRRIKDAEKIA